ncbi:MAG: hypothetical protein MK135_12940, partial [Polyangiaceae bacterium]|nr:hypothetical protein [Polyangiaceae bacterium]
MSQPTSSESNLEKSLEALVADQPLTEPRVSSDAQLKTPANHSPDWQKLAARILEKGEKTGSALARSRSELIASRLYQAQGETEQAKALASKALHTAPQDAIAALQSRRLTGPHLTQREIEARREELQVVLRRSTNPATRVHAGLLLEPELRGQAEEPEEKALLDELGRINPIDPRVQVLRTLLQIEEGTLSSSQKTTVQFTAATAFARELLHQHLTWKGAQKPVEEDHTEKETSFGQERSKEAPKANPLLHLVRAARSLGHQRLAESAGHLLEFIKSRKNGSTQALVLELAAALLATLPQGKVKSLELIQRGTQLHGLSQTRPTRGLMRQLAQRAFESGSKEMLASALASADSAEGTFSSAEKRLFSQVLGAPISLNVDELQALLVHAPSQLWSLSIGQLAALLTTAPTGLNHEQSAKQLGATAEQLLYGGLLANTPHAEVPDFRREQDPQVTQNRSESQGSELQRIQSQLTLIVGLGTGPQAGGSPPEEQSLPLPLPKYFSQAVQEFSALALERGSSLALFLGAL